MTVHYADATVTLHHGDCLDVLRELPDCSVDAVVTDPPYGLGFMGKEWDSGKSFVERKAAKGNTFDHVGGNHNPSNSADAARTRRSEARKFGEWCELWAAECLRVLKPGGHMLAFGGSRTWHRLAAAVEDAGFEIRDSIAWLYGSGFPKSLDVSKAIDKQRTEDRAPVDAVRSWLNARRVEAGFSHDAVNKHFGHASNGGGSSSSWMTNPTSRALPTWDQWLKLKRLFSFTDDMDAEVWRLNGRKGKPGDNFEAREVLAERVTEVKGGSWAEMAPSGRFKLGEKVIRETAPATPDAERWQGWGTALKPAFEPVVVARKPLTGTVAANVLAHGTGALNIDGCRIGTDEDRSRPPRTPNAILGNGKGTNLTASESNPAGRWPANVVLDESQAEALDEQSGTLTSGANPTRRGSDKFREAYGDFKGQAECDPARGADSGGASRFFYVAKADASERPRVDGVAHPTVKPLGLIRWLVRLVTPPGGVVLEPFAGSGTTVEACLLEKVECIAIEREADYLPLIEARISRRRDPVRAVELAGEDAGLFGFLDEDAS